MLSGNATIFGIDPFSIGTTQLHRLGTKGVAKDGRIYRYCRAAGTAIATARLCIAQDITANHEDRAFATAGAVGDTSVDISIGATNIVANEYDEGYLVIIDDTGEGHTHEIVRHGVNSGAATVTFVIKPGLEEATTTATTVTLVRNPYRNVIIADGNQSDFAVGVTPIALSADNYGWLQTGGIASVLIDGALTAGRPITISGSVSGAVAAYDAATEHIVGLFPAGAIADNTENGPVFLTLDR